MASSTVILLAASQLTSAPPPIELEGAGEAVQARMGSSFADMSAGSLTAQTAEDTTPEAAPPEEVVEQAPPEQTAPTKVSETQAAQTVTQTQPQQPTQDVLRSQTQTLTSAQTTSASASAAVSVQATPLPMTSVAVDQVLPSVSPLAPATSTSSLATLQSAAQPETLAAVESQTAAPATAMRPVRRDPVKAAAVAAARPKPKAAKPRAKSVQVKKPTPARKKPKAGNAKRNNTQGVATGSQTAKARTQGTKRKKARQAGNAAVSNYPGLVMRRIARVPKPRVNNRGTAVIAFSVSSSGGLARASVARSSGSKRLDQAALRVIRQAAPFPRPPAGAQRRFSIRIKGR